MLSSQSLVKQQSPQVLGAGQHLSVSGRAREAGWCPTLKKHPVWLHGVPPSAFVTVPSPPEDHSPSFALPVSRKNEKISSTIKLASKAGRQEVRKLWPPQSSACPGMERRLQPRGSPRRTGPSGLEVSQACRSSLVYFSPVPRFPGP